MPVAPPSRELTPVLSPTVRQNRTATPPAESVSKPGFRSLRSWLDSLSGAGYLRAKEGTMASSSCWVQPGL